MLQSKRNILKRIIPLFIGIPLLASCNNSAIKLENAKIIHDTKFNSATIDITIEEFNNLGFKLGDSCDVSFSNGYTFIDVPYYNGYYVKNGDPVIVSYPSSTNVQFTLNNVGIWDNAELKEEYTVTISLKEEGKYKATQEALGQSYSLLREEYDSDEEFSNFRALKGGNLKDNLLYRGASPVDNSRKRASTTDTLLKSKGVKAIVDLADSKEDMDSYLISDEFNSPYTKSLYENDKIALLDMGSSYTSNAYMEKVATGLRHILNNDGPYYIHCMEGKDRTGFVCCLIEALLGASYEEMCVDYMTTYQNYYKISKTETPEKYQAVVNLYFDAFMETLLSDLTNDLEHVSYIEGAKSYLREAGMNDQEIESLILKLSK